MDKSIMDKSIPVKVTYQNGIEYTTSVNGACTDQEIESYFLNQWFNIGSVEDLMAKCIKVEIKR